jgi:chorismate mutase
MSENQQNKTLALFREQIDEIDLKILNLLKDRMEVIKNVGDLKKSYNEKFYIRSNREADMIKNLVNLAENKFPKSAIINIWRKIITTANMNEQELRIAIHNPKNISDYKYLIREYYNNDVPIINYDSANSVVSDLENNNAQIGIFALPSSNDESDKKEDTKENWWISLANNRIGLKIFAKIPFVEFEQKDKNTNSIQLVATAIKEPEKSNSDNTIITIETSKEVSKSAILSALKEVELDGKILKSAQIIQFDGIKFHLIELKGFYLENDEILKKFSQTKIKPYIKVLGHFAQTILI